jgi:hypothetical protein
LGYTTAISIQALSNPFNPIQGYSSPFKGFLEKKDRLFSLPRRSHVKAGPPTFCASTVHFPRLMTSNQTNSKPKSTAGCRKSTVDLGCELLIWGKNGLPTPASPARRHSFVPITTREMKSANQKQTQTGQKTFTLTLQQAMDFDLLAGQKSFMVSV